MPTVCSNCSISWLLARRWKPGIVCTACHVGVLVISTIRR